jgi:hypothetical protein
MKTGLTPSGDDPDRLVGNGRSSLSGGDGANIVVAEVRRDGPASELAGTTQAIADAAAL